MIRARSHFLFVALCISWLNTTHAQIFPAKPVGKLFEVYGNRKQNLGSACAGNFDVNGDGKPDFAVSTLWDTIFIYFGGKNVLDTLWDVRLLGGKSAIVSGDFNGDGINDIVTSGFRFPGPDSGAVLYYQGLGVPPYFPSVPTMVFTGDTLAYASYGLKLAVANLNGDKYDDLIIYSKFSQRYNLMIKWITLYPSWRRYTV